MARATMLLTRWLMENVMFLCHVCGKKGTSDDIDYAHAAERGRG